MREAVRFRERTVRENRSYVQQAQVHLLAYGDQQVDPLDVAPCAHDEHVVGVFGSGFARRPEQREVDTVGVDEELATVDPLFDERPERMFGRNGDVVRLPVIYQLPLHGGLVDRLRVGQALQHAVLFDDMLRSAIADDDGMILLPCLAGRSDRDGARTDEDIASFEHERYGEVRQIIEHGEDSAANRRIPEFAVDEKPSPDREKRDDAPGIEPELPAPALRDAGVEHHVVAAIDQGFGNVEQMGSTGQCYRNLHKILKVFFGPF